MKKILSLALALMLVLTLAACGGSDDKETTTEAPAQDTTTAPEVNDTTAAPEGTTAPAMEDTTAAPTQGDEGVFWFEAEGVKIVCGTDYAESGLSAVEPYEIPSCAFEGSDMIYTYDAFEISAFDESHGGTIYSVYLLDPNVTTPEGLALGDDEARVTALYGDDCQVQDGQLVYQKGDTLLIIMLQDGLVFSIEYRLDM